MINFFKNSRFISLLLVLTILFTFLNFNITISFAGTNPYEYKLVADFSDGTLNGILASTQKNVKLDTSKKFSNGKSTVKWSLSSSPFVAPLLVNFRDEIKADFEASGGNRTKSVVTFRFYSDAKGAVVKVHPCTAAGTDTPCTDGRATYTFTIGSTGWQEATIDFQNYMYSNIITDGLKFIAESGSGTIWFDSVWFEQTKISDVPTFNIQSTSIANNEGYVPEKLDGNNAMNFEFKNNIAWFDSSNAIKVYEVNDGKETLTSKKYTVTSDANKLYVKFASTLDKYATYKVVLKEGTVEDERGRMLAKGKDITFVVGKASGSEYGMSLFDFDSWGSFNETSSVSSTNNTKNGNKYSINWYNHTTSGTGKSQLILPVSANVSDSLPKYDQLRMWIYSEKATNATIKAIFWQSSVDGVSKYFHKNFVVDWTGWKLVTLNLISFSIANNGAEWDKVTAFRLVANGGWSLVGNADTHLYIATADVVSCYSGNTLSVNYNQTTVDSAYSALKSAQAYYAGVARTVTSDGTAPMDNKAILADGDVLIPASEFAKRFNATVIHGENSVSLTLNEKTVTADAGSKIYTVDSIPSEQNIAPLIINEVVYLPGSLTAKLLGLDGYSFREFLVIGSPSSVAKFKNKGGIGVNEFREIAAYIVKHEDVFEGDFTSKDVENVKKNWLRYLVGDSKINDVSNPNIANAINTYTTEAQNVLETLITDGSSDKLFSDMNIKGSAEVETAYKRIWSLARAYGCYGSELYHNEELAGKILYALEHMYQKYFGIHQINGDAEWKEDVYNWADYDLDCGRCLAYSMMVLTEVEGNLTYEDIEKYMAYYEVRNPNPSKTGMNYAEITINLLGSAVLKGDISRMRKLIDGFESMYFYTDDQSRFLESSLKGDRLNEAPARGMGFYTDGSYILHTMFAYNGVYGQRHVKALCMMNSLLGGTKFEMDTPEADNLDNIISDNYESITAFGTTSYRMLTGRVTQTPIFSGGLFFAPTMDCLDTFDASTQSKLRSIAKKSTMHASALKGWYNNLTLQGISRFDSILADSSVEAAPDQYRSKVYGNMDKSVHEQGDWAVGISMHSNRTFNYESINQQNMKGWYLSDGMTEFHLKNDTTTSSWAYWNDINWYRLPGTTVDTQPREETSVALANTYYSSKDFVGGTTLGGKYGVSTMHLESYHADEPIGDYAASSFNGGPNPAHKNDLTAKKAYFMFDEEVVCLGSDINASNNNNAEVLTVVDNRRANKTSSTLGYGTDKITSDSGTVSLTTAEKNLSGSKWVNFGNKFGYYFFNNSAYSDSDLKARWTSGTTSYMEMWMSHGTNPANGKYAYAVLPSKTSAETKAYGESPNVEILANNSSVQSVRNTKLGITGIVFHEAATLGAVTAKNPCTMMYKQEEDKLRISVSDPTQKLSEVTLEIDGRYFAAESNEYITVSHEKSKTVVTVDTSDSLGRSYEMTLTNEYSFDPLKSQTGVSVEAVAGCTENLREGGALSYTKINITDAYPVFSFNFKKNGANITASKGEYSYLNMWVYSPYPQAGGLILAYNGSGNYMHPVPVVFDWSGWKLISVPVNDIDVTSVTVSSGKYQGLGAFKWDESTGGFSNLNDDRIFSKTSNNWHSPGSFGIENVWFSNEIPEGANEDPIAEEYKGEIAVSPKSGELVLFDSANASENSTLEYSTHMSRRNGAAAKLSDFGRAYATITWNADKTAISKVVLNKTGGNVHTIWSGDAVDIVSDYSHINLWLYSPGVKYDQFGNYSEYILSFKNTKGAYSNVGIPASWQGWKLVSIPVSGFTGSYLSRLKEGVVEIRLTANQNCAQWANGTTWSTEADLTHFAPDYGDSDSTTWLSREVTSGIDFGIDVYGRYNTFGDVTTYFGLERLWLSNGEPDVNADYVVDTDNKTVTAEISEALIQGYGTDMALVVSAYDNQNPDKLLYATVTKYESGSEIIADISSHMSLSTNIKVMLWDMRNLKPVANPALMN